MTISARMEHFARQHGKKVVVGGVPWSYYRLGAGTAVLWLTGGLRRAAVASVFLERLATRHTVIAPDYPPVLSVAEFMTSFDEMLRTESVDSVALVGQSYGGMLAQAYLAHRPQAVQRLVLSSSGPADYARPWLAAESLFVLLARLLPEKMLKELVSLGLTRLTHQLPQPESTEMSDVIRTVVREELRRADVVSHFAVAADVIRTRIVNPAAFQAWPGEVIVLSAENDPTQSARDIPRYEQLFGRRAEVMSLGQLGHAAVLVEPGRYAEVLERALD
ncbi:alpha/beta hydrolase [Mycobacterium nebraskense]|nr:alpha/beta hydrolase [Mycobacterium nebraskense]